MKESTSTPTLSPPSVALRSGGNGGGSSGGGNGAGVGAGTSMPVIKDAAAAGVLAAAPQSPAGLPPGTAGTTGAAATATATTAVALDGVTGTWHNGVTVDALWGVDETRNAWMRVVGVGWKKLYNGRDGAFTALTLLASQARQAGRPINYREEADGMVYEIYLW